MYQEFRIWQAINNLQVSGMVVADNQVDLFGKTIGKSLANAFSNRKKKKFYSRNSTSKAN